MIQLIQQTVLNISLSKVPILDAVVSYTISGNDVFEIVVVIENTQDYCNLADIFLGVFVKKAISLWNSSL